MTNNYQKYVNLVYLFVAAFASYVILAAAMWLVARLDLEAVVKNVEIISRVGSLVIGGLIFALFYRSEKANIYMNAVMEEFAVRVTWPTPKETAVSTGVVLVTVVIAGICLALFDWVAGSSLKFIWTSAQRWLM